MKRDNILAPTHHQSHRTATAAQHSHHVLDVSQSKSQPSGTRLSTRLEQATWPRHLLNCLVHSTPQTFTRQFILQARATCSPGHTNSELPGPLQASHLCQVVLQDLASLPARPILSCLVHSKPHIFARQSSRLGLPGQANFEPPGPHLSYLPMVFQDRASLPVRAAVNGLVHSLPGTSEPPPHPPPGLGQKTAGQLSTRRSTPYCRDAGSSLWLMEDTQNRSVPKQSGQNNNNSNNKNSIQKFTMHYLKRVITVTNS